MKNRKTENSNSGDLREKAEKALSEKKGRGPIVVSKAPQVLIHELQVYQFELEMQNDELRRVQSELEKSRDKYSDLYDLAPIGYVTLDKNGLMSELNLTGASMLGVERRNLVGKPLQRFIDKKDADSFHRFMRESYGPEDETVCELSIIKADGDVFIAQMNRGAAGGADEPRRIVILDITGRKKAEEEALREKEVLRQLTESVDEVFVLADAGSKDLIYVSPAVRAISGFSQDEIYENPAVFMSVVHPEDGARLAQAFAENPLGGLDEEFRFTRPTGEIGWIWARSYPVRDAGGEIRRVAGVARDVTQRKLMEDEILKIQKLESVGELAGGIAHDLNNLLTIIVSNIAYSRIFIDPGNSVHNRLVDAENACDLARDLSYRLLTFARGGNPLMRSMSIVKLLEESVRFALSGSNVKEVMDIPGDISPVEIDAGQMKQVVYNLVINAKEAMPGGGILKVRVENVSLEANSPLPLEAAKYVKIAFRDQGAGIPGNILPKIFDPYFTTKDIGSRKGSGLGLSICHSIVNKHGGLITAESQKGKGSVFIVYLPASANRLHPPVGTGETMPLPGEESVKVKILFMDDEALIKDIAREGLAYLGYEVEMADHGAQALEMYRKAIQNGKPFDVVILDLTIRGGIGGEETMRKLLELDPKVRAIVASGYTDSPVIKNFRDYGFAAALAKPYKIDQLQPILRQILLPE